MSGFKARVARDTDETQPLVSFDMSMPVDPADEVPPTQPDDDGEDDKDEQEDKGTTQVGRVKSGQTL